MFSLAYGSKDGVISHCDAACCGQGQLIGGKHAGDAGQIIATPRNMADMPLHAGMSRSMHAAVGRSLAQLQAL